MIPCPKCRSADIREVVVSRRTRAECAGCGRFIGWADSPRIVAVADPASPVALPVGPPQAEEVGSPEAWLYVTKRLDLDWLPNVPLYRGLVIGFGSTPYYRVTARVVAWLDAAGDQLERAFLAGTLLRSQLDAYLDAMHVVWAFADENLSGDAVRAARNAGPVELPEVPRWM